MDVVNPVVYRAGLVGDIHWPVRGVDRVKTIKDSSQLLLRNCSFSSYNTDPQMPADRSLDKLLFK